jgi:hypothetical protein
MSCEDYTKFNSVNHIGELSLINQLEDNLKSFLDWGFLNVGGFINISIPTSGLPQGALYHQLKPVNDPGFVDGRVWQTFKKDVVWETGVDYSPRPTRVSGVYVNNTLYPTPTGSGSYGYHINYPLGRVIFDKPVSSANINMAYSYRWCQVHKASSSPWWTELQKMSLDTDPQFKQKDKGDFNISANQRIQMPCIIIEPISRSDMKPWQIGSNNFVIDQDILLHIFTENAHDKNKLADIIRLQKHKTIILYDSYKVINSGVYGLNYKGSINTSGSTYPNIVQNPVYQSYKCFFKDTQIIDMETINNNLFWCTIRLTTEVIR